MIVHGAPRSARVRFGKAGQGIFINKGNKMLNEMTELNGVSNDGKNAIETTMPYIAEVSIEGICPILFHRWSCEDVQAKSDAKKGSKVKKTDNIESYVYRTPEGMLGIPGVYLTGAITNSKNGSAKYLQDPRSPRKSALDLYKAGVVALTDIASLGVKDWDFVDQRRVTIQKSAITRSRPAMHPGWKATFQLSVLTPEYINRHDLYEVLMQAGRLVGIGDFRPTYGRFQVTNFKILK